MAFSPSQEVLKTNLRALKATHPALAQALVSPDVPEAGALEFLPSRRGPVTVKYQNTLLHSRFDPLKEAQRLVARDLPSEGACLILFGLGAGYLLEAVMKSRPADPVILADPDIPFLKSLLSRRDLSVLLGSPRLHLFTDPRPDQIIPLLERYYGRPFRLIRLRPVFALNQEYYQALEGRINTYLSRKEVNHNTLKRFGSLWMRNLAANLPVLAGAPGIAPLEGLFRNQPALILAAGPSLGRLRGRLKDLRRGLLLIAVDTALRFCRDEGVEPDFAVVVDPQYWNSRHMDFCPRKKTILISESSVWPGVFRSGGRDVSAPEVSADRNGPVFFGESLFPLGKALEAPLGNRGRLGAGGSVATSAWDFSRHLGCSPLYMAGLDLGYPQGQTHCRGSLFEERAHWLSSRLSPAETAAYHALYGGSPFATENLAGGTTLTDHRMAVYQWWFEDRFAEHPDGVYKSLSPEGIKISGMELSSLAEVEALPPRRREIEAILENLRTLSFQTDNREALSQSVKQTLKELEGLEELARRALDLLNQAEHLTRASSSLPAGILEKLNRIDSDLMMNQSREIAGFLIQPFLYEMIQKSQNSTDPLGLSRELYTQLKETAQFHKQTLSKCPKP